MTITKQETTTMKRSRFTDGLEHAKYATTAQELWSIYRSHPNIPTYETIAANPNAPADLLARLIEVKRYSHIFFTHIPLDKVVKVKDCTPAQLKTHKANKNAIVTQSLIYVSYRVKPQVKDLYQILLNVVRNENTRDSTRFAISGIKKLWVENPTRREVSATAQLELIQALMHPVVTLLRDAETAYDANPCFDTEIDLRRAELQHNKYSLLLMPRKAAREARVAARVEAQAIVIAASPVETSKPQREVVKAIHTTYEDDQAEFDSLLAG